VKKIHKPEFEPGDVVILNYTSSISAYSGEEILCEDGDLAVILSISPRIDSWGEIRYCCKFYVPERNREVSTEGCPCIHRVLDKNEIGYLLYGN